MEENGEAKWNVVAAFEKAKEQAEAKKNKVAAKPIEQEEDAAAKKNETIIEMRTEQEVGDAA